MSSSENVASMMEPWAFRPTTTAFGDSWISDAFSRDTKTLTMALQKSLSNHPELPLDSSSADMFMPFLNILQQPETAPTPTVSGLSGSEDLDNTTSAPAPQKRQVRNAIPVSGGGKVSKRKSRAAKRSQTTFITADPSNFRQMVQQVTGVRFGDGHISLPSVLKPEPQRPGNRLPGGGVGCCMPTLDTSAFLLDHHNQQQQLMGSTATGIGANTTLTGSGLVSFGATGVDVASVGGVASGGLGFDSFSTFPTLESWKVM